MKMINFKEMRMSFLIIALSFMCISCNENNSRAKIEKMKSNDLIEKPIKTYIIDLKYEDLFDTVRFNSVSCSQFDRASSQEIKHRKLSLNEMKEFKYFFNETLKMKIFSKNIDVRARVLLFNSDNSVTKICFDAGNMMYKNKIYLISDEFRKYLLRLTETNM